MKTTKSFIWMDPQTGKFMTAHNHKGHGGGDHWDLGWTRKPRRAYVASTLMDLPRVTRELTCTLTPIPVEITRKVKIIPQEPPK